jgi:hypothetical protein
LVLNDCPIFHFFLKATSSISVGRPVSAIEKMESELATATLSLVNKISSSAFSFSVNSSEDAGVDYLSTKLELLLSYCINLSYYLLVKVEGGSIENHPVSTLKMHKTDRTILLTEAVNFIHQVIDQLLLIQGVLDRLKPLDGRMKTELDRLIRLVQLDSASKDSGGDDTQLAPRISNFVVEGDNGQFAGLGEDADEEEEEKHEKIQDDSLYQAPKMSATPFEDLRSAAKEERRIERMRNRLKQSEILRGVRSDLLGTPDEVSGGSSGVAGLDEDARSKLLAEEREKTDWEEEHMMRRAVTKKEKYRRKQLLSQASRLDTIADVGEMAVVWSGKKDKRSNEDLNDDMTGASPKRFKKGKKSRR